VNNYENIKKLKHNIHVAFHAVFANDTFPEQVKRLIQINDKVIQGDMKRDIEKILELYD